MKKIISILVIACISHFSFAQKKAKDKSEANKIETIKIINGDTVIHDIRIVEGKFDGHKRHNREVQRWVSDEENINLDSLLESLDVYMELKDGHKKMMIKKMSMNDEEVEDIIHELEIDEDIIIEMEDGKKTMKVMKIKIDDEDVEEITTIEMKGDRSKGVNRSGDKHNHGLHVFPNPAKDELNIEFEVKEGSSAEVEVIGMNGEVLFSKSYNEPGKIKETIPASAENKGVYIVKFNQEGRALTKKIILK